MFELKDFLLETFVERANITALLEVLMTEKYLYSLVRALSPLVSVQSVWN